MGIRTTIIEDKDDNAISIPNLLFSTNPVIRKKNGVHSKGIHQIGVARIPSNARGIAGLWDSAESKPIVVVGMSLNLLTQHDAYVDVVRVRASQLDFVGEYLYREADISGVQKTNRGIIHRTGPGYIAEGTGTINLAQLAFLSAPFFFKACSIITYSPLILFFLFLSR